MTIDIISYTDAQFAALTEEQILEVQAAQLKKNALDIKLAEDIKREKYHLIDNGTFRSGIWSMVKSELEDAHRLAVENIRDGLIFYLRFSTQQNGTADAPYPIDYSQTQLERFYVVKDYYMTAYTDPQERFDAFHDDDLAKTYIGEYYASLYDYFLNLAKEA